ncbi:MAG: DUF4340 domain-containing protein [Pseudomonadales bacterium]
MNGRIGFLLVVLGLQLVLIAALWWQGGADAPQSSQLLAFDQAEVTRIRITERDSQDAPLLLERTDGGWVSDDLPVAEPRVQQLLERLAGLDSPWPVATTAAAAERFEVTDDGYAKYIELLADEQPVAQLLLGTSPGFKRIHARVPDQEAIYSIALTSLDAPVAFSEWLDKSLLASSLQVRRIARLEHWEAVRDETSVSTESGADSAWSLRALDSPAAPSGVAGDAKAIATLLERFTNLQVLGGGDLAGQQIDRFELQSDSETLGYTLYHDVEADVFTIARDDRAGRYELAGYLAEQLRADLGNLVQAPTAGDE